MDIEQIKEIKVNDEQLKLLQQYKKEQFELKSEIHSDIAPMLIEGFRQMRELTQNIAIIAGAIASFTIPILNTSIIQTKYLAYSAVVLLFGAIIYAVYHLSEVIPKEINALSKQHSTYNELIDESINRINKTISTGDVKELDNFDKEEVVRRAAQIKTENRKDASLDILRTVLFLALLFLSFSFIPFNSIKQSIEKLQFLKKTNSLTKNIPKSYNLSIAGATTAAQIKTQKPFNIDMTLLGSIITSLTALSIALFSEPLLNKFIRKTKLVVKSIASHTQGNGNLIVYRALISNEGLYRAKDVEVYAEEIIESNNKRENFLPVPFGWTHAHAYSKGVYRDIHPNQSVYLDVFDYIISPKGNLIRLSLKAGNEISDFSNINKGEIIIKSRIYQASGQTVNLKLKINWNGIDKPELKIID
jgi:hypothetical protein